MVQSAVNLFVALKFVKLLATPWKDWEAFKLGLIDNSGNKIKKAETSEEKSAMSIFHILTKNVKRLLEKIPFGKSKLATYATALYLIREEYGDDSYRAIEDEFIKYLKKSHDLSEDFKPKSFIIDHELPTGKYIVTQGPFENSVVILHKPIKNIDYIMNTPIFEAINVLSHEKIIFAPHELRNFDSKSCGEQK